MYTIAYYDIMQRRFHTLCTFESTVQKSKKVITMMEDMVAKGEKEKKEEQVLLG